MRRREELWGRECLRPRSQTCAEEKSSGVENVFDREARNAQKRRALGSRIQQRYVHGGDNVWYFSASVILNVPLEPGHKKSDLTHARKPCMARRNFKSN